jgi:HK97 family phage prohead protease
MILTKGEGDNLYHFVFSSADEDRHGDIVEQNWVLKNFKNNPVVLDSHNYDSIEHIIGKINKIAVKDGKLQGDIEFALMNPKGLLARNMAEAGFLFTTSVGFIPMEFDDEDFFHIIKSELLEVSLVSVPANPKALIDKIYDKSIAEDGVNTEDEKGDENQPPEGDGSEKGGEENEAGEDGANEGPENQKSLISKIAEQARLSDENRSKLLKNIASELERTTPANLGERKRKIYQSLRLILSKDNANKGRAPESEGLV